MSPWLVTTVVVVARMQRGLRERQARATTVPAREFTSNLVSNS
jgi:hypothetical protein